ncbi:hypothetical protein Patl1_06309 [Pistacia atlantica]|uniref:Uncharacterized protein n=1 Tax=Pistacia atlantica TaxID=434234 RepID=A0ACC1BVD0_9ROSI|nr:hypothetical protein Patl1_06309 [Pistacia atlantica]
MYAREARKCLHSNSSRPRRAPAQPRNDRFDSIHCASNQTGPHHLVIGSRHYRPRQVLLQRLRSRVGPINPIEFPAHVVEARSLISDLIRFQCRR